MATNRPKTMIPHREGDVGASEGRKGGGLLGCFGGRRRRKSRRNVPGDEAEESRLVELQTEVALLHEHHQQQEANVARLKDEMEMLRNREIKLKEKNMSLREDLNTSQLEIKSYCSTIDTLGSDRLKLQAQADNLSESLRLSQEETRQIQTNTEQQNKQVEDAQIQLLVTQDNLQSLTQSFHTAQERVEKLERQEKEDKNKIEHLEGLKTYLAKSTAEKDIQLESLKSLYDKDRDAFQRVQAYYIDKFEKLKEKHYNILRYLWKTTNDCTCKGKGTTTNDTKSPIYRPHHYFTEGISWTREPNRTQLNTTLSQIEQEMFRYRIMNQVMEDRITEYEPEFTLSSISLKGDPSSVLLSSLSSLSGLSVKDEVEITPVESLGNSVSSDESIGNVIVSGDDLSLDNSFHLIHSLDRALGDLDYLIKHNN